MGAGRSFSRVAVVGSSGHFAGFIGQYSFSSPNNGVNPAFRVDEGLPAYTLPPQINPAFQNNQVVDYWNGLNGIRAPENITWTMSFQRQLTANTVFEAAYNASLGSHLPSNNLNLNQIPKATYDGLVNSYGATQANNILRAAITAQAAIDAGVRAPYANFNNAAVQLNRTAGQALRPFPQYQSIQDRCPRRRQERPFHLPRPRHQGRPPLLKRPHLQLELRILQTPHRRRQLWR